MTAITLQDSFPMEKWEVMSRFLQETYRPDYILTDRKLFEWQFCMTGSRAQANIICAWDGPELVGILGYMPLDLFWGRLDKTIRGAWMANWMVRDEYRTGIGAIIMRRLMERCPVLLGQGANDMNQPIAKLLRFKIYPRIPRYVAVFDSTRTSAFFHGNGAPGLPDWRDTQDWPDFQTGLPEDYAPDWRQYPGLEFGTVRSRSYLDWRYARHPMFEYTVLVAGNTRAPAVCVTRLEQTRGAVNDKVGRVVEWFYPKGPEGETLGARLMQSALARLKNRGAAFADFYITAGRQKHGIRQTGLKEATDLPLATRMNPVEPGLCHQNLEVWTNPDVIASPGLCDLYITKSDGDQDRPN